MLIVGLPGDHLYGKLLFTWLSLVMSLMVSFVLSLFLRDVLDGIFDLIESVSEDFPTYFCWDTVIDCAIGYAYVVLCSVLLESRPLELL